MKIGDKQKDGSIYVGQSQDGHPTFTTAKSIRFERGFLQKEFKPHRGHPSMHKRTASILQSILSNYAIHGHTDWKVPTLYELDNLMDVKRTIKGFNTGLKAGEEFLHVFIPDEYTKYWDSIDVKTGEDRNLSGVIDSYPSLNIRQPLYVRPIRYGPKAPERIRSLDKSFILK